MQTKIHKHLVVEVIQALEVIFSQGKHADKVIEKALHLNKKWGSRDRKFFAECVYDIVRWYRWLNTITQNKGFWWIWGAYRLLVQKQPVPDWPELQGLPSESVLRQLDQKITNMAVRHSVSDWFYEHGLNCWGESDWSSILQSLNQPNRVYLRCNLLKSDPESLRQKLLKEGIESITLLGTSSEALMLPERKNVFATEAFRQGLFEVQDLGSQKIAPLLQVKPGQRVIDACAGAGGKSLHLASLMKNKGKVISLDIHSWKLEELKKRARRNGIDIIETRTIDSSKVIKRLHESADALLLDVPCSGSGVLRRNPDTKWKLQPESLRDLHQTQDHILQQYSTMLKIQGRMVYATCSVFNDENQIAVKKFLDVNKNWRLEQEVTIRPDIENCDGFYAAALIRES